MEALLAIDADVPGRGRAAGAAAGVDWFRRCVFAAAAGAVVFLGPAAEADVAAVVSACIDSGRREVPVAAVDAPATAPLLNSLLGTVFGRAGFLSVAAAAAPVEVFVLVLVVLVLSVRFGTSSFFAPVAVPVVVAVAEAPAARVELLKVMDLAGTGFFTAAPRFSFPLSSSLLLSFKFLAPTVRRIAVRCSLGSFLGGAGGGGIRALSAEPVSDVGVTCRLIFGFDSCDGEGNRESVGVVAELSTAAATLLDGVGMALRGVCLAAGVEGVEGTGIGMVGWWVVFGGWVVRRVRLEQPHAHTHTRWR